MRIGLIPGDGIGKEVVPVAAQIVKKLLPETEFVDLDAGWETFQKTGESISQTTLDSLRECDGAIFGAVQSPSFPVEGYRSPIVRIRKEFDLYANLRPVRSIPIPTPGGRENVDMMIVRENTECLYIGQEKCQISKDGDVATATRLITAKKSNQIARMAMELAKKRRKHVTICHKANVFRETDGLFRRCCYEMSKPYVDSESKFRVDDQLVDSLVMKMIQDPTQYDVIVAPNLYGDILSDAASAFTGGLGMSAGLNLGDEFAMAEPVHGSAPDIAGKGLANPLAAIKSAGFLLETLGVDPYYTRIIEKAINTMLQNPKRLTPDLGGKGTTQSVSDDVLEICQSLLKFADMYNLEHIDVKFPK